MLIVDDAISNNELVPDIYMSTPVPSELPYSKKSKYVPVI